MAGQNAERKINPAAAENDIRNISRAKEKLEQATASIKNLRNIAAATQGQTGQAIMDQCDKLQNKVDALQTQLSNSQKAISIVVQKYEDDDRGLGADFRRKSIGG